MRGPSLMRGYWGQPAKTSEVLVRNPFRAEYDELVYRTGDLVTLEPAGNYAYLGRRDGMVKVRGYRVELGEVEATLYRHPAIREAAVLPVPDELLGSRLRAVVTADDLGNLTRENVLDHCRRWLPSYMVPDIVEFRETMPRTSTGKVDRVGLAREPTSWSRPNRPAERQALADTWKERARVETVIDDYISRGWSRTRRCCAGERHVRLDSGIHDSLSLLSPGGLPGSAVRDHDGRRGSARRRISPA